VEEWFMPSEFFARRCLRILPPYYIALILAVLLDTIAVRSGHAFADQQHALGAGDVLAHVLLLHNLTRFNFSINGSFWTLGLEWQWYFLFPVTLYLCILYPRLTLAVTLLISVSWAHLLPGPRMQFSPFQRLFEFSCGILVARLSVEERALATHLLIIGLVVPITLAELAYAPWFPHLFGLGTEMGLGQSLYGISFSCLALLGYRVGWLIRLLSWQPLMAIGIASYSIYLVHEPVVEIVDLALARDPFVAIPLAIVLGLVVGLIFYAAVERPLLRKGTTTRAILRLRRLFLWSDSLWRLARLPRPGVQVRVDAR
jgi:peptidoglycan/LPS O-acetylase OafA/YrhL